MSSMESLYQMIGPAGVVLLVVAFYAIYLSIWMNVYLIKVWRNFRKDFLDLEHGKDCCLQHLDSKAQNPLIRIIYDIAVTWNLLKIGTVFRNEWDSKLLRGGTL